MSQADQAEAEIREQIDDDVLADAEQADGVNVSEVIQSVANKRDGYQTSTQARFAQAALGREIEAADGETLKGILMGCRDRYSKSWPRRYSLVRSSGDHIEISSWESTLPGPDGHDVDLQPGSIAAIGCEYNAEYEDYNAERVERLSPLDKSELVEKLDTVAIPPREISRSDEYEIVAVQGRIAYIDTQTLFSEGQPDGEGPVLMPDGREVEQRQPHFEIALEDDNGTRVRGHLERQNVGQPYVDLPEIEMLLEDAMDAGGPEAQASFLQAALEGLEVTIIGNVNSVNTDRDDEGNKRTYVEIAATAVVDMDATDADGAAPDPEPESEPEPEPEPESKDDSDGGEDGSGQEESPTDATAQNDAQKDAEAVASDIETAANLQGANPAALTLADVKDMAPALADDHPDEVLQHAVSSLADGDDSSNDESGSASSDGYSSGMDALEACRDDGLYKCPADGCLVQVGEQLAFMTHVEDEHADGPAPEWVSENV